MDAICTSHSRGRARGERSRGWEKWATEAFAILERQTTPKDTRVADLRVSLQRLQPTRADLLSQFRGGRAPNMPTLSIDRPRARALASRPHPVGLRSGRVLHRS